MKNIAIYQTDPISHEQTLLNLFEGSALIGSGPSAEIIVNDIRCSGIHAMIVDIKETQAAAGCDFQIIDLGNGSNTFYQNRRVKDFKLKSGDYFTIGNTDLTVKRIPKVMLAYQELLPKIENPTNEVKTKGIELATEKTLLETSIYWGQQLLDSRTFEKNSVITIGSELGNTFSMTLPDRVRHRIAQYKNGVLQLKLPSYAKGIFWEGDSTYTLEKIREKNENRDELEDSVHILRIGDRADIQIGEMILSFKFVLPSEKVGQFAPIVINRTLLKIYGIISSSIVFLLMLFWLFEGNEIKPPQVPENLRKVLYEAGVKTAKNRQQSAIGEILASGGRAKGEEGASKSQKSPTPKTAQTIEKVTKEETTKASVSESDTKSDAPPTITRPDLAAIKSQSSSSESVAIQISGAATTGNTLSSISEGSFARGSKGLGSGGGGKSVGIGQVQGLSTGGGLGAGDMGVETTKGITINSRIDEQVVLQDALDQEVINAIIKRYLPQIDHCYQTRLVVKPKLKGKVKVSFEIIGDGSVAKARIVESGLNDSPTEECIVNKINNWKFPAPKGGGKVKVTYPFILMSTGDSE